jgi:hypothetical protein
MQSLIDSFHLVSCSDSRSLPSSSSSPVSLSPYDSEDEVVWSLSSSSISAAEHCDDDEDFVLLHKPPIRKTIRRWSDQVDAQESAPPPTKPCNDIEAENVASRFTPVDRTASVTPIPTSTRRPPITRGIRPPPVESPASTFVSADTQEVNDQRKPVEQAPRRKRGEKFKKEAKAAAVKTTTSEEQTKKERKRAARRRRKERMMLRKQQAEVVTPVTKETPTKAKVVTTTTTSAEMYEEASLFITSCVSFTLYLDDPSILGQVPRGSNCEARLGLPFDLASIINR